MFVQLVGFEEVKGLVIGEIKYLESGERSDCCPRVSAFPSVSVLCQEPVASKDGFKSRSADYLFARLAANLIFR